MFACDICQKGVKKIAFSRHQKGHGVGGVWALRAPIYKKTQKPNLHKYMGMKLCTKCLRAVKKTLPTDKSSVAVEN